MRIIVILCTVLFFGCGKTVDIPGFNEQAWQSDPQGCEGLRQKMKAELTEGKEALKGLNTDEMIGVLGKPDKTSLTKRNQKYFFYRISPGETCENYNAENNLELSIRFSAIGLAYEVLIK